MVSWLVAIDRALNVSGLAINLHVPAQNAFMNGPSQHSYFDPFKHSAQRNNQVDMSEASTPPPASASPQDIDITLDQAQEEHHHIDYKLNEADETSEHVVPQQQSANDSEDPSPQQFSPEDKVMTEADPETTDINGSTSTSNTDDTNQSHEPTSGSTTQTNTPVIAATATIPNGASTLAYPPANKPLEELSMNERMVKVGRSCPCEEIDAGVTCDCQGWKPSADTSGLPETCACGHRLSSHGGPWFGEEFDRRLKAAFRRDELLQVTRKFDYSS